MHGGLCGRNINMALVANVLSVTDKLIKLVSHVKQQNDHILAWIAKQNINTTSVMTPDDLPFSFPLESFNELNEFDEYIRNNIDKFKALESYLSTLGGNSITSITNRIIKHLLSDVLTVEFNYFGQRSLKRPFCDLTLKI